MWYNVDGQGDEVEGRVYCAGGQKVFNSATIGVDTVRSSKPKIEEVGGDVATPPPMRTLPTIHLLELRNERSKGSPRAPQ